MEKHCLHKGCLLIVLLIYAVTAKSQLIYYTNDYLHNAVIVIDENAQVHLSIDGSPVETLPFEKEENNMYYFTKGKKQCALAKNFAGMSYVIFDATNPVVLLFTINATNANSSMNGYQTPKSGGNARKKVVCQSCHGTGKCGICNGTGYFRGYELDLIVCTHCSASNGRICSVCNGTGYW